MDVNQTYVNHEGYEWEVLMSILQYERVITLISGSTQDWDIKKECLTKKKHKG